MKKRIITLALALVLVFALASTVSAVTNTIQANLTYRDIKITLNGAAVDSKDANGKSVEPFIMDGTTYLPVRAVAEALGLNVKWDSATSTVALTEPGALIEGEVIYDNEYVTMTLKSQPYKASYSNSYYIDVTVYNKSDLYVTLYLDDCAVNNFMVDIYGASSTINPGAKSNLSLYFNGDTVEVTDASQIEEVVFSLEVWDADTWKTYSQSELLHLNF